MIRAYKHTVPLTTKKKLILEDIYVSYRDVAKELVYKQLNHIKSTGKVYIGNELYKPIISDLSERYKDTCNYQVDGMMKSWLSNAKNRFKLFIKNSSIYKLSENLELKKKLYQINSRNLWFSKIDTTKKFTDDEIKLAKRIMNRVFKITKIPSTSSLQMILCTKLYALSKSNCKFNGYWMRLSTKTKRQRIYIPISKNIYEESKKGIFKNACQIIFDKSGKFKSISLIKEIEKTLYTPSSKIVGLDFGLCNLFATSEGDLFGRNFIKQLKKYDARYQKLIKSYKANKIEKFGDLKRFKSLVSKMRGYIKNESNRVINRIVEVHKPSGLAIEDLNFSHPRLSKQLNRILKNCGLGNIKVKLDAIHEELGIKITYVNPTYLSQACKKCKYVDSNNRKTQSEFKCLNCGHKCNSDVSSSIGIKRRSFNVEQYRYKGVRQVSQLMINEFVNHWFDKKVVNRNVDPKISYKSITGLVDKMSSKNPLKDTYLTAIEEYMNSLPIGR